MAVYTKRVQTVLSDNQFEGLMHLAHKTRKPVSVLIREAVDEVYFSEAEDHKRRAALERIVNLNLPVADWEQMEAEIISGFIDG